MKFNKEVWIGLMGNIGSSVKNELDELIISEKCYHYTKDLKIENYVYNCYGDFNNNRLYLTIKTENGTMFYGRINSNFHNPEMVDRRFGLDAEDNLVCAWLSDMMIYIFIENKTEEEVFEIWRKQDVSL